MSWIVAVAGDVVCLRFATTTNNAGFCQNFRAKEPFGVSAFRIGLRSGRVLVGFDLQPEDVGKYASWLQTEFSYEYVIFIHLKTIDPKDVFQFYNLYTVLGLFLILLSPKYIVQIMWSGGPWVIFI